MKKVFVIICALCLVLSQCAFAEEVETAPAFVEAKIITTVTDEGQTISGLRIEYDAPYATGALTLTTYSVVGYQPISIYVNSTGVVGEAEASGKYVFVEFALPQARGYSAGKTLQYVGGGNLLRDLTLDVWSSADGNVLKASGYIHNEVDDYLALTYTNENGDVLNYRLFIPEGYEAASSDLESVPLVIWMHGGGERGDNNFAQIAANRGALNYSKAEAQAAHPCFVLAPQAPADLGWGGYTIESIRDVVNSLLTDYSIDASRIYVTGCSMGGQGTRKLLQTYPEMFAAAVVIANNTFLDYSDGEEDRSLYGSTPIWFITSEDDSVMGIAEGADENENKIVTQMQHTVDAFEELGIKTYAAIGKDGMNGYLRGVAAAKQALAVREAAEAAGATKIFTTYLAGTVQPAAHWSWMAATDNSAMHDWLFDQVNDAPYAQ